MSQGQAQLQQDVGFSLSITHTRTISNVHYYESNEKHAASGSYLCTMLKNFNFYVMDGYNEVFKKVVLLKFILK